MAFTACEAEQYRTELDEVQMELDELKQRLDEFCARFNTNLAAIKSIVEASRTNDYISGVKPLIENGVEVSRLDLNIESLEEHFKSITGGVGIA